jgi:tetratricopeptide (TPR) repeat protein
MKAEKIIDNITIVSNIKSYIETINWWLLKLPRNSDLHHIKANELVTLAKKTGERSYYDEALISYNKAIALSPQNLHYLLGRIKLYIALDKFDLAEEDLLEAKEILRTDGFSAKEQPPALSVVLSNYSTPSEAESQNSEPNLTGIAVED